MSSVSYDLDYRSSAAASIASERASFVRRVYMHLAGAVLVLIGVETVLLNTVTRQKGLPLFEPPWSWLAALLLVLGARCVALLWAQSRPSMALQYLGLGLYVLTWAIAFLPMMIAARDCQPNVIPQAGIITGAVSAGLMLAVFVTRKDYSFLGAVLSVGSLIVLGVIVAGYFFHFTLGLFFCVAMVALVSGYILHDTSRVMLYYPSDMHVAAALELLADVAMLFWYIVNILLQMNSRD